jgi:hypothetical protein
VSCNSFFTLERERESLSLLNRRYDGTKSRVEQVQELALTTHSHLVPRLRKK